jgi:hypothetical protein
MNLKSYFAAQRGTGVMATADQNGVVNSAIYARPHIIENTKIGFVMRDRLSHKNLLENPNASYLFKQDGAGTDGIRLRLIKLEEFTDHPVLEAPSRKQGGEASNDKRYFVTFQVDRCYHLVGGDEIDLC